MMKVTSLLFVVVLSVLAGIAFAADEQQPVLQLTADTAQACEQLKQSGATGEQLAKSGCCSWHKGVCGCSGGRQVCCDGSFSPSCTCNKEEPPVVTN